MVEYHDMLVGEKKSAMRAILIHSNENAEPLATVAVDGNSVSLYGSIFEESQKLLIGLRTVN